MWNDTPFTRRLGIRYPIDVNDDDLAIGGDQHRPRSLYLLNEVSFHIGGVLTCPFCHGPLRRVAF